jgi:hypothetical protein
MLEIAQADLKPAVEIARIAPTECAPNGIRYGSYGDTQLSGPDLAQIVQAVPQAIAAALQRRAYYFVPLALGDPAEHESGESQVSEPDPETILISSEFSTELGDAAVCHRNATVAGIDCIFISTRLMQDRFALAFELYINAGHHFVEAAGVPESFMHLVWSQAEAGVRGETSQDAWEHRAKAVGQSDMEQAGIDRASGGLSTSRPKARKIRSIQSAAIQGNPLHDSAVRKNAVDEKARTQYFEASFADAIAIYLLSLTVDFDYTELREREYPLLAAPALAERLRHIAQLFPPNPGHEFSIRYRRRNG